MILKNVQMEIIDNFSDEIYLYISLNNEEDDLYIENLQ